MFFGDGDMRLLMEYLEGRPSGIAVFAMCRRLKIEESEHRTIDKEDAWKYFHELIAELLAKTSRKQVYDILLPYLSSEKIDEHLEFINQHQRKTA